MGVVIAVGPDAAQARVLRDVARRAGVEVTVVESTSAAIDAINVRTPDLLLLSTLLSPRDEDALMAHLRLLEGASHLQTLTIPQFSTKEKARGAGGFGFRKKQPVPAQVGCDPRVFADEIAVHLDRAAEIRNRPAAPAPIRTVIPPLVERVQPAEPVALAEVENASVEIVPVEEPAEIAEPAAEAAEDEIDALVRKFGLDVRLVQIDEEEEHEEHEEADTGQEHEDNEAREFIVEADATLAAALDRARADAEERRFVELARVQAEAEAMRDVAIVEARAAAEREARETLAAELARVRAEAEGTLSDALNKVKVEAEEAERLRSEAQQAFAEELTRVRAEVEQTLATQLDAARAEADRVRAAEAEVVRMRAEADAQLKSELERIRQDAERARQAEQSKVIRATEQIREAAAVEARAIAEAAAQRTLETEIARVRSSADRLLETELTRVRAEAERRQRDELDELRAQMVEMREAAAQQARTAAADAVASAIRKEPRKAVIAHFPTREIDRAPAPKVDEPVEETVDAVAAAAPEAVGPDARPDYYSLWQEKPAPVESIEDPVESGMDAPAAIANLRRHAKWALPTAACLLLVTNTGTAISTMTRLVNSVEERPAAAPFVEEKEPTPAVAIPVRKVGELKVESDPAGAEVLVDGRRYGQTPVTIPSLSAGTHTLVLRSTAGTVTRRITIKAGESFIASEAIFAGWMAIFSPVAVDLFVDGLPVTPTEDGRLMIAPGEHQVEMVSQRFNYRATETLVVRPGEVTAHTVVLPSSEVLLDVPDGMEVRVDGEVVGLSPLGSLSLSIGTHEISATHPELGERRASVDVRFGEIIQVPLQTAP